MNKSKSKIVAEAAKKQGVKVKQVKLTKPGDVFGTPEPVRPRFTDLVDVSGSVKLFNESFK